MSLQDKDRIFTNLYGYQPWSLDAAKKRGDWDKTKKLLELGPEKIIEEIKASGLRGRGGAGFPTGLKWSFMPKESKDGRPSFLVINADESEPGSCKDREIIRHDPHKLIEGALVAGFAMRARAAYIYIRGEYIREAQVLEAAVKEAYDAGLIGKNACKSGYDFDVYVHRGAGAYICGEETGLIESLEGKRPYPRIKPPYFPAALGLYMSPTIVNNVESLCHVKHILQMGGAEYAKLGTPNNTGTRILCVSGDVQKPGYYEVQVGKVTMGEVINDLCGGLKPGRKLKAIIPGGSSAKVLRADETFKMKDGRELTIMDIPMDFDTMAACGTMAGSGGVIIMDDSRSMSWVINNLNNFYAHESCGQCTPCREGSLWMKKISDRIVSGNASPDDVDTLEQVAVQIDGRTICAFGEASAWPTQSFVRKFRDELKADCKADLAGQIVNSEGKVAATGIA
jgi:NADH-quinone oxidoreductase subunit F